MSGSSYWLLVALGIGVVIVRRRSVAVALVTLQALVLAAVAASDATGGGDLVAAIALGVRAVAFAVLLGVLIARTREPQRVRAGSPPLLRAVVALGLALILTWLVPEIGLTSRSAERAVLALIAFGVVTAATRRATLFQVMGIVLLENGVALAALTLPGISSPAIELGVTIDLTLVALVAAAFHERIFAEFGAGDTAALRTLRD
jgi:hydrogenase-4 membrane subunit HyfE